MPAPLAQSSRGTQHVLDIEGMSCASCAARIEDKLRAVPGVRDARVNFAARRAYVEGEEGLRLEDLTEAVRSAGYRAVSRGKEQDGGRARPSQAYAAERSRMAWRAGLGLVLCAPFLAAHFAVGFPALSPRLQFLLALPVFVLVGWPFHRSALAALRRGEATMDTLVSLGAAAAFFGSLPALARASAPAHFEAAALIPAFLAVGRWLEVRAKQKAGSAVEALLNLRPRTVHLLREDRLQDVPLEALQPGAAFVVRPGELVPVDGLVLEGTSTLDESLLTGESMPVPKKPGMKVVGGSLNGEGSITVLASHGPQDTTLSRMLDLVERAQGSKAPVQRLADRVASVFVPAVILLAGGVLLGWGLGTDRGMSFALERAVAVLVVACPCALGLATPVALLAGTGAAARRGVLVRRIEALERAKRATVVVFDKTGTLTEGRPRLSEVYVAEGWSEEKVLRYAAGLESGTNHPLARAVLEEVEVLNLPVPRAEGLREIPGAGVTGRVEGREVALGTKAFVESLEGVVPSDQVRAHAEAYRQAGQSVSYLAADGRVVAVFAFEDTVRAGAADAVAALKRLGLRVHLLTGDQRATAERVGAKVGADVVEAEVGPEDKLRAVWDLQSRGEVVCFVGDGVNDAPALAAADLGVALDTGTDAAREASDLVLVQGDLGKVAEALWACRRTLAVIRQNLFWAFFYNLAALPLAALAPLPPSLAAAAMAASSLTVVLNSLRLLGIRRGKAAAGLSA